MALVEQGRLDLDAPVSRHLKRCVFQPLGMLHSTYQWSPAQGTSLATIYGKGGQPATHFRFSAAAASSLYTSVADLTRFLQAHLPGKGGEPVERRVLAPSTVAQMWQPTAWLYGQPIWGLGTMLYADNRAGGFVVGHDGTDEPAVNTAARLAGEWVFWEAGRVDFLAF